ncbi:MAG TPA: Gfo/Idh/MocA family oxidoreductase [Longimicrobium sp.]|uniref:Gfo/Idh/MocA family oxidoreductase n=1 Tax=Longimicrobium sp. TaxID=2029185 RepID=UPI002ED7773F
MTRAGVLGVGSLGFHHARILRDVSGAEMAGVWDDDPARLAHVAQELGVRAFRSRDELLESVDAAVVAVPTTAHAEVALAALHAGVHLLIEKPIAHTLEEANAIVSTAAAKGLTVQTGHVERFNGALRACEPYLEDPRFVESHRLAPFNPRGTDVAVVLDLMIHDIDLVLGLVGRGVESLDAIGVPVLTPSADIANARINFENGAVANITASRVSFEKMRKVRFFQQSGYISLDLAAGTGEFLRLKPGARLPEGSELGMAALLGVVERVELKGDGAEPLRAELEAWVKAVRGEGPLVVSGEAGRDALAVALRIMERIEQHAAAGLAARA